jgi:hypothetical protein
MEEASGGFLLAFLLPFHVAGGAALGVALHRIIQGRSRLPNLAGSGFLLVWGSMFGGLPLVFGLTMGSGWIVLVQLSLLLGTIVFVALRYEWLRALYSQPGMFVASFGLTFFLVGALLTASLLGEAEPGAILPGLIFGGIGGLLTAVGVWMLLRIR